MPIWKGSKWLLQLHQFVFFSLQRRYGVHGDFLYVHSVSLVVFLIYNGDTEYTEIFSLCLYCFLNLQRCERRFFILQRRHGVHGDFLYVHSVSLVVFLFYNGDTEYTEIFSLCTPCLLLFFYFTTETRSTRRFSLRVSCCFLNLQRCERRFFILQRRHGVHGDFLSVHSVSLVVF